MSIGHAELTTSNRVFRRFDGSILIANGGVTPGHSGRGLHVQHRTDGGDIVDTTATAARLHLAGEASENLQRGLHHRQEALLDLEQRLHRLGSAGVTRAIIDQAEDIRRAVRIHQEDQLVVIRDALMRSDDTIVRAGIAGDMQQARTVTHLVSVVGEETRRLQMDLGDASRALEPTAQALPDQPDLASTSQRSVGGAMAALDRARRSAFRIVEDLPLITRAVEDLPEVADQPELDLDTQSPTVSRPPPQPPAMTSTARPSTAPGY